MAENPFSLVDKPFRFRILTPLLVSFLPFETVIGFSIINITALVLTSIIFYFFLKKLGFSANQNLLGLIFFIYSPITIFLLQNICMVDFLLYFFFISALYSLLIEKRILFTIIMSIGLINKETILLVLIFYFFWELKINNKSFIHSCISTFLSSIIPLIVFVLIRLSLGDLGADYFNLNSIINILKLHYQNFLINPFYPFFQFYLPFGMLWILSILGFSKNKVEFLKILTVIVPFALFQVILAVSHGRLLFILFPIIIPLSIDFLRKLKLNKYSQNKILLLLSVSIFFLSAHLLGLILFMNKEIYNSIIDAYIYIGLTTIFALINTIILGIIYYERHFEKRMCYKGV